MSWVIRRWLFGALLLGALLGAFFGLFERSPPELKEHRFTNEAQSNPLLAARRLLRRMGFDARTVRGLDAAALRDRRPHTVMVSFLDPRSLPVVVGGLESWVASGGNLILAMDGTGQPLAMRDGTVDAGRDEADTGLHPRRQAWKRILAGFQWEDGDPDKMRSEWLTLGEEQLRVRYRSSFRVPTRSIWQQHGGCMASRAHGEGRITMLCATLPLTNRGLGIADHATWVLGLVTGSAPSGTQSPAAPPAVWLVSALRHPSLVDWLWERVHFGLLGLLLVAVVWIARVGQRFGHIIDRAERPRRSISEHIEASAYFLWRNGGADVLLEALRADVDRRAGKHHPRYRFLDSDERREVLRRVMGEEGVVVEAVLSSGWPGKSRKGLPAREFVRQVRILNAARGRL